MKKFWTKYLKGTVIVRVEGEHAETFLNYCLNHNIHLWDIKRMKESELELHMFTEDALHIKKALRETGCRFRVVRKSGAPFIIRRMISRGGFIIGMLSFFVIVFLLSNMVWKIEVSGADPQTEHHLRKVVDELGIKRGKLLFRLPDPREVQYFVTEKMDEVTWVGVTLDGTTFKFKVVQKELPEEVKVTGPQNLIAKKKAFVTDMFIEQGQPKVERNQMVQKGELLVSGYIGKDKNTRTVAAKGKVFGEVWYRGDVTLPLESSFETYTGNNMHKHYLTVFGKNIPIWGFGEVPYENYQVLEEDKSFRMFIWELPISYLKKDVQESERVLRKYTEKEAIEKAKEMADKDLKSKLDDEAKIKSGKILHHTLDNGKVKVSMYYKVIENIVKEQPIIGGD
ncbi:sporulation protein YqfD [Pseudalkalibacillus sp. A8]|uniref:sporulation protein YqfD n=1 Tax=Pseudalkalibacillus sp. A8 TaxID=3382641 RepID=UPI0038B5607B